MLSARRQVQIDRWIRHLPAPAQPGARLLDVGCGNGSFLDQMRQLGWAVVGIEPDAGAVAVAKTGGLEVHQGLLDGGFAATAPFDAITLGHVVEHLHDPAGTLRHCLDLLRPGGWLWIATPNLQSAGHKRFGPAWRGLEPPRHLVIFTPYSLRGLLERIGFVEITQPRPDEAAEWYYLASAATEHGLAPERWTELPRSLRIELQAAARQANDQLREAPDTAEELVLLARKPSSS